METGEFQKAEMTEKLIEKENPGIEKEINILTSLININNLAFPVIIYFWCIFLEQVVLYYFIGKKYPEKEKVLINSMGITNIYMNTIVLSISIGLLSGIDTLCSNAYGASNFYLVGVYWRRGTLITLIFTLLFGIFNFLFGTWLLSFIVVNNEVLIYVSEYIRVYVFSLFFEVCFSSNIRYLNVVNKAHIPLIIVIFTMINHIFCCWIFIDLLQFGIQGGAFAILITNLLNTGISSLYIHIYNPCPQSYFSINSDCLKEWKDYLAFTIPSLLLNCFEWWAFELQSIIVFYTTLSDFNAHVIGISLFQILMAVTGGFGTSMTIIIGKMIVENSIRATKKMILIIIIYGNTISVFLCSLYYFYDVKLFEIFIDPNIEPDVILKAKILIKIFLLVQFFDFQQTLLASMYKSFNLQKIASVVAFTSFYLIQTLVSLYLGIYLGFGVVGCWLGICSGSCFSFIVYFIYYFYIDMEKIKENIMNRMGNDLDKLEFNK